MSHEFDVVTRLFQAGKTWQDYDVEKFEKGFVVAAQELLRSPNIAHLIVVTCGEGKYSEKVVDGKTPTIEAICHTFPSEIASGRVITHVCDNWGLNAGSATALNDGLRLARQNGAELVMNWSSELKVTPAHISRALDHIERHSLDVCSFLRSLCWLRPTQWMVPQNTGAIWNVRLLESVGGFSFECNGDGKTTIHTEAFGEVPLAGMEDMHAIMRMFFIALAQGKQPPRLGMVCRAEPIFWDLSLKKPGTREYDDNMKKIARQAEVVKAYARNIFPDKSFDEVFMWLMSHMHID